MIRFIVFISVSSPEKQMSRIADNAVNKRFQLVVHCLVDRKLVRRLLMIEDNFLAKFTGRKPLHVASRTFLLGRPNAPELPSPL
jgi:hypothetical protein